MSLLLAGWLPPQSRPTRGAGRLIQRNLLVYKRIWLVIIAGFCEPVFYLLGVGVGLGEFVGEVTTEGGVSLSYAAFVAPGLLAASAMNGAIIESTFPIFFKLHYNRTYDAVLSTPMRVADIAVGEILWSQLRAAIYACGFLVLMYIVGLTDTLWAVVAILGALLVGFTFSAAGFAAVTFMRTWHDFDMIQLVILPLFLFSGTFYPLSVYPSFLQPIMQISPLYHGTELLRAFTLGSFDWTLLAHAGVLVAVGLVGLAITSRRLGRTLLK
ncbi:MAG: ABC transporter [Acidimicrobiia bacterium]|nr:ABC transporter permease [bacterium]MXY74303.1 ABC transporter [Acidimicrobiia bacterium]MYB79479.1 ABC transporter [Acidimicrobiia bacterium]MYD40569.1 ABC transporter [Acidimicrobiia bacterium]